MQDDDDEILRGDLADVSYPELIKKLHDEGLTGALTLVQGPVRKTTYLEQGRFVFARSNDRDDRLGEFLLRRGAIDVRAYLESASRIAPGKRQGAILCEMGAIAAEDLVRLVKEQVTEILYSQFSWVHGEFEIHLRAHEAEMIALTIPIEDVLLEGLRRVTDWARIWKGVGESLDTVFVPTAVADSLGYRTALSEDERHVLSLVTGKIDVGRILSLSYAPNLETCRTLWSLRVVGAIERIDVARPAHREGEDYALAEMVEAYDRYYTFIHAFVAERIGDLVDHFFDRAAELAVARHPETLAGIYLRNQGRIEYEQVFASLSGVALEERRVRAGTALRELGAILVVLAGKEIGAEEEGILRDQLRSLAPEVRGVDLEALLDLADALGRTQMPPGAGGASS
jgi:hypothetical protein